jgi:hemerythrin
VNVPGNGNGQSTILAVDDDPAVTEYLQAKLGARYRLISTNSPNEALQIAQAEQPDLILLDVDMPELDGFELCRRMKKENLMLDAPVIFLTARNEGFDEVRGFEAGGVDYIHKRLDRSVLEARVRQQLTLHESQRAMREKLREAMHNLRTTRVCSGVYWVQVPEADVRILCGSPADVVKHLMLRGYIVQEKRSGIDCETGPNIILLSDLLLQNGRFANLAEFPVLQMFYRQGLILPGHPNNTGMKPILAGSAAQVRSQLDYIYRGNYGLASEEELREAGLSEEEAKRHMALKLAFAFGKIRPSEELLDYRIVDEGKVELARGVWVRRIGLNKFQIGYLDGTTEVDLNLPPGETYDAPYTPGQHHVDRQYFAVVHSGEGDGWDLRRQSMGSIVLFQGRCYLVDAGPGILDTLKSLGIDIGEVEGIFHTHAHDDHFAGLPALLVSGRRIKYFTTRLVRHSVMKKLAALTSIDEKLFQELFDVHDLMPGQWNDCDGMEVMPIDSPHPVENNIFLIRARDDEDYKTYAHWADIVSFDVLRRLLTKAPARDVLPPDFFDSVRKAYHTPATVKKIDAGGGLIHGEPLDFRSDQSAKIILAHRATNFSASSFSQEQLEVGSEAVFGAVDVLIPSNQDYIRQHARTHLEALFPDAQLNELNALLRNPVIGFNAGSLILRRGSEAEHLHLLLAGTVEQLRADFPAPLTLSTGSLLGSGAVYAEGPLGDSWRAASPVRTMRFAIDAFRAFLRSGGWYERFRVILSETEFLRRTWLFGERLTLATQARIARSAGSVQVAAGERIDTGGTLMVVRHGEVDLIADNGRRIQATRAGGFFGEEHCLGREAPPWHAVARGAARLLAFPAAELRSAPVVMWKLIETWERRSSEARLEDGDSRK